VFAVNAIRSMLRSKNGTPVKAVPPPKSAKGSPSKSKSSPSKAAMKGKKPSRKAALGGNASNAIDLDDDSSSEEEEEEEQKEEQKEEGMPALESADMDVDGDAEKNDKKAAAKSSSATAPKSKSKYSKRACADKEVNYTEEKVCYRTPFFLLCALLCLALHIFPYQTLTLPSNFIGGWREAQDDVDKGEKGASREVRSATPCYVIPYCARVRTRILVHFTVTLHLVRT
jgi:hypothetical protein